MTSSPFLINPFKFTSAQIMWLVALLLLPTIITMWVFFGLGILVNLGVAVSFSIVLEWLYLSFIKKSKKANKLSLDGSIAVSSILFALCLPPHTAIWLIFIASLFMVVIIKHLYGGLGNNIFNPAMATYAFVLISFPLEVTIWPIVDFEPGAVLSLTQSVTLWFNGSINYDAITSSTPLSVLNHHIDNIQSIGLNQGVWFIINLVSLIAGLFMMRLKIISWHLPMSFLVTFALIVLIYVLFKGIDFNYFWLQMFSGATMLGAFFILTDPVTAATSNQARIAQGICFAILLFSIRSLSTAFPDGIAFAIILCNMINPLLDKLFKPKRYGY